MKFELKPNNRNPDKNLILKDMKSTADNLGKKTLTASEYNEFDRWHSDTPIRLFGKWNKALILAGLEIGKRMNIPDEELFEQIQQIWERLGRQPYSSEISNFSIYKRRFGTWHGH